MMNTRQKYSVVLISLGFILALIPLTANRTFTVRPETLLSEINDQSTYLTVDQVAKLIVSEDSTFQLIDLRTREEFSEVNIPGSVNIPYSEILNKDPASYLINKNIRYILYSNGDFDSNLAFTITRGLKINNTYVMSGGLNEWFRTVMNSRFTGEKISVRENALFETRTRAGKLFTQINSLPDSLKMQYILSKQGEAKKLDGGCE